jgi:hypothetical protein
MPLDAREQRYRDNAAECMKRARAAESEGLRAVLLHLAQKWLDMASDRFGTTGRDPFDAALAGDNDGPLPK